MANNKLGTRTSKNKNKKKANIIYNIILGVVIIAIVIVASSIFTGNDEDHIATEQTNNEQQTAADENEKEESKAEEETVVEEEEAIVEEETQPEEQPEEDGAATEEETDGDTESAEAEIDSGNEAEGEWKPVGTQQTGEHTVNFTKGSVDWIEMEKALAYGAGIDQSDMTVWFLGNGGAPDKATGTISSKSSGTKYKVNIQWVNGQGWKPTSVQQVN